MGGLFRHVRDLARGLHDEGQRVGIICDSLTGGEQADRELAALEKCCALGISRLPVSRLPGLGDFTAARQIAKIARTNAPDIIHGHGAKGGLYARLAGRFLGIPSVYVPHGGSLHFKWSSPSGALYLTTEKLFRPLGSGLHFVCAFERDKFAEMIGLGRTPARVIHNGLWPEEFIAVEPAADADDIVTVGELRWLKGVDVLLKAIALANKTRRVTAAIVGDGGERATFEDLARALGLGDKVRFTGAMPARAAFRLGRVFVMPSRAESFPYVILEAAAAKMPIIASDIGGIPEILDRQYLVPPDDPERLAAALLERLDRPRVASLNAAQEAHLTVARMSRDILSFYRQLIQGGTSC